MSQPPHSTGVRADLANVLPGRRAGGGPAEATSIEALRAMEARHRLLTDLAPDVVWAMAPDGRITHMSPASERVRGFTPDEAMTQSLGETHPAESGARWDAYRTATLAAIARGERPEPFHGDLEYLRKDGTTVWTEVHAFPMLDERGRLVELLGVSRDLSERRAAEHEHRQAQRMESMGRLAAGVAHQMNNLLAIIRAAAEPDADGAAGSEDSRQRHQMILRSVDRAAALTAQLLSFSRRQHLTPERLRLADLVAGTRPMLERVAAPQATLDVAVAADAADAVLEVDRDSFEQALVHLVANARDALPYGGTIRVRGAAVELRGPLATQHTGRIPAGAYATITVEDDGVGMDTHVLEHLFEPFFTTKAMDKGTGLGLPSVFGVLKQHDAGITVESEAGKGSRFTLYWPMRGRAAADAVTAPAGRAAPAATRDGKPLVLVVDDEPFLVALTRKVLERIGCEVLTAPGGREALRLAHAKRDVITLVLTDVRMPGMTGPELVDALIQQGIDLPVLFMSGQLDAPIPTGWPATVPRRFIAKPFKVEQLTQELVEMGVLAEPVQG